MVLFYTVITLLYFWIGLCPDQSQEKLIINAKGMCTK